MTDFYGNPLPLIAGCLAIGLRFFMVRRLWNQPLNHGPNFFFGAAVSPGFDSGRWLRRYHILLAAQYGLLCSALLAIAAAGRWNEIPILAPADVISFFALIGGFTMWARRAAGTAPETVPLAVIPLEIRRLRNYISWPAEILMGAILAASWLLLLRSGAAVDWGWPIVATWVVVVTLPGKIILVRNSFPLPPERTEEYHRWLDETRRHSLRVMDAMRWFVIVILAGYAAQRAWPDGPTLPWIRGTTLAVAGVVFAVQMTLVFRGTARLTDMGRDLRPVGSFQSPYRPASLFLQGGLTWSVVYCGGLGALLLYFSR